MTWVAVGVGVAGLVGGMMQSDAASKAAEESANAQIQSAKIGADASRFTPVGTTTRFAESQFGYDPSGRLNAAGYYLSPEMQQYQDYMMQAAGQGLDQYGMGRAYAEPMLGASQDMMGLGQQYLGTSPQEQASKYMANQQALLAPGRAAQLSKVRGDLFNTGRTGLAVGGDEGTLATNPEMAAYYNAMAQQDAQIAAQADQSGMDYAKFGAGMLGTGGQMLGSYYDVQNQAMSPYQAAMAQAQGIEGLGQGAMDIGTRLGAQQSTAGATQGNILSQGGIGAARTMQQANSYSPFGAMLSGGSQAMQPYLKSSYTPNYGSLDFIPDATAANSVNMTGFQTSPW